MKTMQMLTASTLAIVMGLSAHGVATAAELKSAFNRDLSLETKDQRKQGGSSGLLRDRLASECGPPKASAVTVSCVTGEVSDFAESYRARAARRQTKADYAAGASVIGVMGLFAGGAGAAASTQQGWSFLGVTPILANDLNAPDHRGMLDMGGAAGLDRLAERYRTLEVRLSALDVAAAGRPVAADIADLCRKLVKAKDGVRTMPDDSRRTLLLEGIQELIKRCRLQQQASIALRDYSAAWSGERTQLGARSALDALEVTRRIDLFDRAMRASPFEAFRTAIAAPFLTVGGAITGNEAVFNARADPRKDRDYVVVLRSLALAPALPAVDLATDNPLTMATEQALAEVRKEAEAARTRAAGARGKDKAKLLAQAEVIVASTPEDNLIEIAEDLSSRAQLLNVERRAALLVAAADGDNRVNIDPRLLTKVEKAAEAAAAAEEPAAETPKPGDAAKPGKDDKKGGKAKP